MSTQSLQQYDLAREVRGLKRMVAKLLKRLEQPVGKSDLTIQQWCAKRNVSRAGFYKLKKDGRAPRTIECKGVVRITADADRDWEARFTPAEILALTTDQSNDEGTAA
jgi:hypothetical protein